MLKKTFLLLLLLLFPHIAGAQDTTTVPDITGLSVPAAAALLNRNALVLGTQSSIAWTADSGLPENSISLQAVEAGESVARGTAIDVTILRSNNMTLVYDDNDITLVNRSGGVLTLNGVAFNTAESTTPAAFSAARWGASLAAATCGQFWSVGRTGAKDTEGCEAINWLTSNNSAEHFWTALNGVTSFNVTQNGSIMAQCPAAPAGTAPLTCDFFLDAGSAGESLPYIYMAYTTTQFIMFNNSEDKWLPISGLMIVDPAGSRSELATFTGWTTQSEFARVDLLAPGQCLLIVANGAPIEPPQPCDVIAAYEFPNVGNYAWLQDFSIDGVTDDQLHVCSAAVEGRLTLCLMPR